MFLNFANCEMHKSVQRIAGYFLNIAKGTTDPRIEFLLQVHSTQILIELQFQNLD